jgi:hypothetical protein
MKQSNISIVKEIVAARKGSATKDIIAEIRSRLMVSANYARVMISHANKAAGSSPSKVSKKSSVVLAVKEKVVAEASKIEEAFEAARADGSELSKEEFAKQRAIFANLFGSI